MRLAGRNLPNNAGCCSTNNIFFEIHRGSPQGGNQFYKVYDSDPILDNVNPMFPPFKLSG
jgi:hypothetical protein